MSTLKVNNVTDLGDDAVITDGALVGAGKILQVVSTALTSTFSISSGSFQDVTGLAATITPSSTSSKIMVIVTTHGRITQQAVASVRSKLIRESTDIFIGDASASLIRASAGGFQAALNQHTLGFTFLDSPNTTSATTYKIAVRTDTTGGFAFIVNSSGDDQATNTETGRIASSITLMEVAG